jgi:hypothetical protein
VRGTLTKGGQPIRVGVGFYPGTAGFCATFGPQSFPSYGTTGLGTYEVRGVPAGTYRLLFSPREAPGGNYWYPNLTSNASCADTTITLGADQTVNFNLP